MEQSRRESLIESLVNVAIGYFVALLSQFIVFPWFGIHIPFRSNIMIGLWFTVISVARSYVVRRWFNYGIKRLVKKVVSVFFILT